MKNTTTKNKTATTKKENQVVTEENTTTTTLTAPNKEKELVNEYGEYQPGKVVLRDLTEKVKKQEMDEKERIERNKEAAKEAKEKALKEAMAQYMEKLKSISEDERLHFYLANPYIVYRYNYIMYKKDGTTTNRENASEFKIKLSELLSNESYIELTALVTHFRRSIVELSNAYADNDLENAPLKRTEAKNQLKNIFQFLATEKYKKEYIASHNDLQRVFNLSFTIDKMQYDHRLNILTNDKNINVIDNINMINVITWALSQRLNDKNGFIDVPVIKIASEDKIKTEIKAS